MSLHLVPDPDEDDTDPDRAPVDSRDDLTDFGDPEAHGTEPLFDGDIGQLPRTVRETLVAVLKRRYIAADRHPDLWRVVVANEPTLQSRLNDLFLELVIDRDYQIAYKRQATSGTGNKFPTLVYDKEWNREETILLVFLRRLIRSDQKAGDFQTFVDREALLDEVRHFRSPEATNQAAEDTRARNAIDTLVKTEILLRTDTEDRYRLSPVIEVLLPVSRVKALGAWLTDQNARPGTGPHPADDTAEPEPDPTEVDPETDPEENP